MISVGCGGGAGFYLEMVVVSFPICYLINLPLPHGFFWVAMGWGELIGEGF
jgi:hypothetical protein